MSRRESREREKEREYVWIPWIFSKLGGKHNFSAITMLSLSTNNYDLRDGDLGAISRIMYRRTIRFVDLGCGATLC